MRPSPLLKALQLHSNHIVFGTDFICAISSTHTTYTRAHTARQRARNTFSTLGRSKTTPRTISGSPARQTPKYIWSAPYNTNVAPDTMAATPPTPRRKARDENLKMRERASKTLQEAIENQVNDIMLEGAKAGDHHLPKLLHLLPANALGQHKKLSGSADFLCTKEDKCCHRYSLDA